MKKRLSLHASQLTMIPKWIKLLTKLKSKAFITKKKAAKIDQLIKFLELFPVV